MANKHITSSGQAPSLVGSLGLNLFSYILIQKAIYSLEIFSGVMVDGIDELRFFTRTLNVRSGCNDV